MPEGHTIHRLARDHAAWFAGGSVRVSSPQGRFADAAALLDGARLERADAHGKHLLHRYEGGRVVHIHLGLFGKVLPHVLGDAPLPEPRATVRYRVVNGTHAIDLVGATTCELLTDAEVDAIVARLGPDPIRRGADPQRAWEALRRRSVGIGRALMDQRVLSGVGNIYRAEVLFVHGVHPELPTTELPRATWDAMWATLVTWMRRGVQQRRIITVDRAEIGRPHGPIPRGEATYVYQRERCLRCATPIRRWDLAGRWVYACETCQPLPRRDA